MQYAKNGAKIRYSFLMEEILGRAHIPLSKLKGWIWFLQ
jgi:hypothetical protein